MAPRRARRARGRGAAQQGLVAVLAVACATIWRACAQNVTAPPTLPGSFTVNLSWVEEGPQGSHGTATGMLMQLANVRRSWVRFRPRSLDLDPAGQDRGDVAGEC